MIRMSTWPSFPRILARPNTPDCYSHAQGVPVASRSGDWDVAKVSRFCQRSGDA